MKIVDYKKITDTDLSSKPMETWTIQTSSGLLMEVTQFWGDYQVNVNKKTFPASKYVKELCKKHAETINS